MKIEGDPSYNKDMAKAIRKRSDQRYGINIFNRVKRFFKLSWNYQEEP